MIGLLKLLTQILDDKWGYIYGTSGKVWTQADQNVLVNNYASNPKYEMSIKYGDKWIGHHVADCSGLVCYVWRQVFSKTVPHGSNSQIKQCTQKGYISSDELPIGTWLFKTRDAKDFYHVGLYLGNGEVVEARGARYGVVKSLLTSWQYYGIPDELLDENNKTDPTTYPAEMIINTGGNGKLNLRRAPSGQVIDRIPEGQKVTALSEDGQWTKVAYTKQVTGYVMTRYLEKV